MNDFIILTDTACDINSILLKEWQIGFIEMSLRFENEEKEYLNNDIEISEFYNRMRNGETAKTSAINPDRFSDFFEEYLKQGKDILYLGFSSGLSTTYNSARIAAESLLENYSERKIIIVDTMAASSGQGLLVYFASKRKSEGASIEEVADYIENIKMNLCHWFTVDDLVYLKRGGRISPTLAFVGGVLGIKPVLHVDNEGKLVSVSKVRGRKAALKTLVEKYGETALDKKNGTVFISQGDCNNDADEIKNQLKEKYGANVEIIADIGPVIGAHSGPGTIAIFYVGMER